MEYFKKLSVKRACLVVLFFGSMIGIFIKKPVKCVTLDRPCRYRVTVKQSGVKVEGILTCVLLVDAIIYGDTCPVVFILPIKKLSCNKQILQSPVRNLGSYLPVLLLLMSVQTKFFNLWSSILSSSKKYLTEFKKEHPT